MCIRGFLPRNGGIRAKRRKVFFALKPHHHTGKLRFFVCSGRFRLVFICFGFSRGLGIQPAETTWLRSRSRAGSQCFRAWTNGHLEPGLALSLPRSRGCWKEQCCERLCLPMKPLAWGPVRKQENWQVIFSLGPEPCKATTQPRVTCQATKGQTHSARPASSLQDLPWEHCVLRLKYALNSPCPGNYPP